MQKRPPRFVSRHLAKAHKNNKTAFHAIKHLHTIIPRVHNICIVLILYQKQIVVVRRNTCFRIFPRGKPATASGDRKQAARRLCLLCVLIISACSVSKYAMVTGAMYVIERVKFELEPSCSRLARESSASWLCPVGKSLLGMSHVASTFS